MGPPGSSYELAFATINVITDAGFTEGVISFGGTGTTGTAVVRNSPGDYTITFTGSYPTSISATKLVVLADAHANLAQATTSVLSASTSSISIEVFTFVGSTNVDESFSLVADLGQ
jgi:hypothetical protein